MDNILKKASILIPIQIDSDDRLFNINFLVDYYDDFNIIIKETGLEPKIKVNGRSNLTHIFEYSDNKIFHKTKVLNDLYRSCESEIMIIIDGDVIVPKDSIAKSIEIISNSNVDAIYPYRFNKGVFMVDKNKNGGLDKTDIHKNSISNIDAGYGYCLIIKKSSFESIGCENEDFFGYAPEDWERKDRIFRLLSVNTIDSHCYHINHEVVYSHNKQPFFNNNQSIYDQINSYNGEQYVNYVNNLKIKYKKLW